LHLAHDWQQVLREIARVLRPNGQFLQGRDWIDPESVVGDLRDELRRFVMSVAPNMKPPSAGISKDDFLASLSITDNTQVAEVVAAEWVGQISASERLYEIENRLDAESWGLPDSLFDEVLSHLQEYAANKWHDLEKKESVKRRFLLKTTRGHW
jgi:SAM-dependent methyltransferase